jgi:hypothetical protein
MEFTVAEGKNEAGSPAAQPAKGVAHDCLDFFRLFVA